MQRRTITRRQFIGTTAAVASGLALSGCRSLEKAWGKAAPPTAVDQVELGKTGIKLSRLGFGCGSKGGSVQRALGQDGFTRLVRYAYDQGITYIDTAQSYKTHEMVREATKGLPREKLFIQTKMSGVPDKPLEVLDRFRKELGTDYIDSLLTHCTVTPDWDDERRRVLDAMEEAKDKQIVRAHGVSCHSLPALKRSVDIDWTDVHLVRLNPQGVWVDTPAETWNAESNASHVPPVMEQMARMREKGHGVIGMKLIGNGLFTKAEDRDASIKFVMNLDCVDAVTIGMLSEAHVDEAIERMNTHLNA